MKKKDAIQLIFAAMLTGSMEEQQKRVATILDLYITYGDKSEVKGMYSPIEKLAISENDWEKGKNYAIYFNYNGAMIWCASYKEFLLKADRYPWFKKYIGK